MYYGRVRLAFTRKSDVLASFVFTPQWRPGSLDDADRR